jgi:hypothetical protein
MIQPVPLQKLPSPPPALSAGDGLETAVFVSVMAESDSNRQATAVELCKLPGQEPGDADPVVPDPNPAWQMPDAPVTEFSHDAAWTNAAMPTPRDGGVATIHPVAGADTAAQEESTLTSPEPPNPPLVFSMAAMAFSDLSAPSRQIVPFTLADDPSHFAAPAIGDAVSNPHGQPVATAGRKTDAFAGSELHMPQELGQATKVSPVPRLAAAGVAPRGAIPNAPATGALAADTVAMPEPRSKAASPPSDGEAQPAAPIGMPDSQSSCADPSLQVGSSAAENVSNAAKNGTVMDQSAWPLSRLIFHARHMPPPQLSAQSVWSASSTQELSVAMPSDPATLQPASQFPGSPARLGAVPASAPSRSMVEPVLPPDPLSYPPQTEATKRFAQPPSMQERPPGDPAPVTQPAPLLRSGTPVPTSNSGVPFDARSAEPAVTEANPVSGADLGGSPQFVTNIAEIHVHPQAIVSDPAPFAPITTKADSFQAQDGAFPIRAGITPIPMTDEILRLVQIAPNGPVTLTLRPDDLGTLRFEMTQTDKGLHIHLAVDQPQTLDLLRRQGDQLLADLRQAGFAGASLSFAGGGTQDAPSQHSAQMPDATRPTGSPSAADHRPTLPSPIASPGTLDLRL